jgi:integrase
MAPINRLTAIEVQNTTNPGLHPDGGGLYLYVGRKGNRSWVFRFTLNGKAREMGLGSIAATSLANARRKAADARAQLAEGIDPINQRDSIRASKRLEEHAGQTFDQVATAYITSHQAGWKNAKHASQWSATLRTYCRRHIGALPVQAIDTPAVLKVLKPIWAEKPETANRVRGRIESILNFAKAMGYRTGDNPARWTGHLDQLLPAKSKVRTVKHHAALPYAELPSFIAKLRAQEGTSARCLEFTILTAARTGEAIAATWDEFDEDVWTLPEDRTKSAREHRVPLSTPAIAVVDTMRSIREGDYVFAGGTRRSPHLSNMAMLALLARMGYGDMTVHGFRAAFRTWAAETTAFPREVVEAALAHVTGDRTERAYQRGELFEKRRRLMDAWAAFCSGAPTGNVMAFPAAS